MGQSLQATVLKLCAIFLGIYLFEITSFPLSIDEELVAIKPYGNLWISQGRWGGYLVERFLVPQPTMPYLAPVMFGACCVASYLLTIDAARRPTADLKTSDLAGFAVFCGYPTWLFIVEFYSNMPSIGLGMLAASTATWLHFRPLRAGRAVSFVLAAILAAFAIAAYQSFLFYLVSLGGAVWVLRRLGTEPGWRDLWLFCALIVVAIAVYAGIDRIFLAASGASRQYVQNFFRPDLFLAAPVATLQTTAGSILGIYGFSEQSYLRPLWAAPAVFAVGAAALFLGLRAKPLWGAAIVVPFAALLAPFALHVLAGGSMPVRTLVGVPVAVWLFAYVAMEATRRWVAVAGWVAVSALIFQSLAISSAYQASNVTVAKHDQLLAASIADRIALADGFDPGTTYKLVVYGGLPFSSVYPQPATSTVGRSFFEWDGGNAYRIKAYMRIIGFDFEGASVDQQAQVVQRLAQMPLWPARGSVAIEGNIAMVRLGKHPNSHNSRALALLAKTAP